MKDHDHVYSVWNKEVKIVELPLNELERNSLQVAVDHFIEAQRDLIYDSLTEDYMKETGDEGLGRIHEYVDRLRAAIKIKRILKPEVQ